MDHWERDFRQRLREFGDGEGLALSVKVRVDSGCFCKSCCPAAHKQLDAYLRKHPLDDRTCRYIEHETDPEFLVYLAMVAGSLNAAAALVNLVTAVIKARTEGYKAGDKRDEPMTVIIRGIGPNDEYFERNVITVDTRNPPKLAEVKDSLSEAIDLLAADSGREKQPPTKTKTPPRNKRRTK